MSSAHDQLEHLLGNVLNEIDKAAANEITLYLDHDEWGLAYDVFIFLIREGAWRPGVEHEQALRDIAESMSIRYPALSTET